MQKSNSLSTGFSQEELRKFFYHIMTEKEIEKINSLHMNEIIAEIQSSTYQIKYIENVGYVLIGEGYLILDDGSEPTQYFAKIFISEMDAKKEIMNQARLLIKDDKNKADVMNIALKNMNNDISSANISQINKLIDEMNIIVFDKTRELLRENRVIRTYKIRLFNDIWYLYDFFYYASKCYDKYFINFVNENHEVVTKKILTNEFVLQTENIKKICEENKLKISITLYVNNRHLTISKQYGKDEITIMSTLDEKGLDIDKNIDSLISNYLNWIQSEHIYAVLKNSDYINVLQRESSNLEEACKNTLININEVSLASAYYLIDHILKLSENEYEDYYNTNLQWLEEKFTTVSGDKKFWIFLMENIGKTLILKKGMQEIANNLKYNVTSEENKELIVKIPSDFQKVNTLPEDPENSVAYIKQTESSTSFLMIYPINSQNAMPYENEKAVIDGIHRALVSNQGLIEVQSGLTNSQKKYIYSIVKSQLEPSGIQYILTMHIDMNNLSMNIQANFEEIGMTGMRDTIILNKMMNEGKVIPPNMNGWSQDPYDENYKQGLLMNMSEKAEYDVMFPQHPLSEARLLIKYILDNN